MMDLRSQMKVVDLLLKLFRGDLQHINPYPFVPQKHKNCLLYTSPSPRD